MIFNRKKKYLKKNKGFSLMEVIIAIAIITVGVVGLVRVLNFIVIGGRISANRLVAVNLAQEGMEVARNNRDESLNWSSWNLNGNYRAEMTSVAPYKWFLEKNPTTYQLNYDSSTGFYQYNAGELSIFSRKIIINTLSSAEKQIIVQVTWSEHGRVHTSSVESRLYDWR